MTRGVIFDMDGVLVDSYKPHYETWKRSAEARGLSITPEQFAITFGRTSREIIKMLWSDHAFTIEQMDDWDRHKEELYREVLKENFPAMIGADDLLAALHSAGFKLAIGSSGPPENVALIARLLKNGKLFDAQVNGRDVLRGKPDPAVFLTAAQRLGLEPAQCLVVEDAPVGVAAGKAAGMAVIAITGTAERSALSAADAIVDSLTEITPQKVNDLIDRAQKA